MEEQKYAIIKAGGKQFQVVAGSKIFVEKIEGEIGSAVTLNDVLLVNPGSSGGGSVDGIKVGTPLVSGASVSAKILRQDRAPKVMIFKKKIRKGYTKKQGHRQARTQLLIEAINM